MPSDTVTAAKPGSLDQQLGNRRKTRARAPLRLGLAGGGTDVSPYCDDHGGLVLNATIDRYCYATVEQNLDGSIEFRAPDIGVVEHYSRPGDRISIGNSQLLLHRAVYDRLCSDFDLGRPPISVTTVSDAPPGSGLGSSSTVVVAILEAFREYFSLPLGEYDVARLAVQIERSDCGLEGGRQDQYAATFGGFNIMEFGANDRVIVNPLRLKSAIVRELEASIILFHTGASRASASIISEQKAHISKGDNARLEATHTLKQEASAMKEALLTGDLCTLAAVLNKGWEAKKRIADNVTNERIARAFEIALASGAVAGKVSGAGGGGYILFVAEPTARAELVTALDELPGGNTSSVRFVTEGAVAWTLQ